MLNEKQNFYLNNFDLATWCLKKISHRKKIQSTVIGFSNLDQTKILRKI